MSLHSDDTAASASSLVSDGNGCFGLFVGDAMVLISSFSFFFVNKNIGVYSIYNIYGCCAVLCLHPLRVIS